MTTENWTEKEYLDYTTKNELDELWYMWCNPQAGIRLAAIKPRFTEELNKSYEVVCPRKKCTGGYMHNNLLDNGYKVISRYNCTKCNGQKDVFWRWNSPYDRRKIWFKDVETVRKWASVARTIYSTLAVYDKSIVSADELYNVELIKAYSLGLDIDIISGTILEQKNREALDEAIQLVRNKFDSIGFASDNWMTSGNGAQCICNHNVCTRDIADTIAAFNELAREMQAELENKEIKRVKIDAINDNGRVYKLFGTIHQKYDCVAVPLQPEQKLAEMKPDEFKIENFSIQNHVKGWYRFHAGDDETLKTYFEENYVDISSSPRVKRYTNKRKPNSDELITVTPWIKIVVDDIEGDIYYKKQNDEFTINMFAVKETDRKTAIERAIEIINKE